MKPIPAALLLAIPFVHVDEASGQEALVIQETTIVSAHLAAPLANVSILIEGERIVAIEGSEDFSPPVDATIIDGRNRWVVPGIVDVHSHSLTPVELGSALALGVTMAQTLGRPPSPDELERESHSSRTPSPRLKLITGYFGEFQERMGAPGVRKPTTAHEARQDVIDLREAGVEAIKIWQDDGSLWFEDRFPAMPEEAFLALVDAAHDAGISVYAHAWRLPFFELALEAGVDGIIHPVADTEVPAALWDTMREQNLSWTTTMTVLLSFGDPAVYANRVLSDARLVAALDSSTRQQVERNSTATQFSTDASWPVLRENSERYVDVVQRNTVAARANDVDIVVGSDSFGTAPVGVGTHIEMELLAETGLTPLDILVAATINGAQALGFGAETGTIEVGKLADLIVLNSDPLEDVKNWRNVETVIKGGHAFDREQLLPAAR